MKPRSSWFLLVFLFGCVSTPETGRNAFILTSPEEENALGERAFREVLTKERLSTNQRWTDILQRVGQRVADASRARDFRWEFRLVESREKNAFCLPGGKVAFYTGIFNAAKTEAGLAAVMGHEVAHATARHAGQRITLAFGTQIAFEGLNSILNTGGKSGQKQLLMAALGVGVALPFSRANETEADEIGIVYMARAGYDPAEAVDFWKRFAVSEGLRLPRFLSTHPHSEDRVAALEKLLPKALREYRGSEQYGTGEAL